MDLLGVDSLWEQGAGSTRGKGWFADTYRPMTEEGVAKVVVTIVTSYRLVYMNFGIG